MRNRRKLKVYRYLRYLSAFVLALISIGYLYLVGLISIEESFRVVDQSIPASSLLLIMRIRFTLAPRVSESLLKRMSDLLAIIPL